MRRGEFFPLGCSGLSLLEILGLTWGLTGFLMNMELALLTPRHDGCSQGQQAGVWTGELERWEPGGEKMREHKHLPLGDTAWL